MNELFDAAVAPEPTPLVHWQLWDVRGWRGTVMAVCGEVVPEAAISGDPTCPVCKAESERYNALEI